MNGALFRQTWRSQRVKLAVVSTALAGWGVFLPIIYAKFGSQFRAVLESGLFPEQFARFGGGDIFSLPGSLALSLIHPIAIILTSVFFGVYLSVVDFLLNSGISWIYRTFGAAS